MNDEALEQAGALVRDLWWTYYDAANPSMGDFHYFADDGRAVIIPRAEWTDEMRHFHDALNGASDG